MSGTFQSFAKKMLQSYQLLYERVTYKILLHHLLLQIQIAFFLSFSFHFNGSFSILILYLFYLQFI